MYACLFKDPYERDWELGQTRSLCGSCDNIADCACGLLSGEYKCSCPAGYYGSGYTNDCHGECARPVMSVKISS